MKQLIGILILAVLVLGFAPGVLANENDTNSTNETQVRPMQTPHGAEVRLLQLEKQLVRAKLHGEQIVDALEKQNASTGNLSGILAEFDVMILEVQEARAELNRTNTTENAVRVFVALVHDARQLTKEFREATRALLREADKRQLKDDLEKIDRDELKDFDERIKHARREYNAENAKKTLERIGVRVDDELHKRIKEGRVDGDDLRDEMKERVRELTTDEREEAIAKLREEAARARIAALARIEEAQKHLDEVDARYEARIKLAEEHGLVRIEERLKHREDERNDMREKLEMRENNLRIKQETRMKDGVLETRTRIEADDDSGEDNESDMNDDDEGRP